MSAQQEQKLFRQQVVDEVSTKLNGEVILNSNFSRKFIAALIIWLLVGVTVNNFIEIKIPESVVGIFSYDKQGAISAKFFMSPDQADNFYPGRVVNAEIRNIPSEELVIVPIEITTIDKKLKLTDTSNVLIQVTASVNNSNILIKGREYKIDEGIPFFIAVDSRKMSLTQWVFAQLFGDKK